MRASIALLLTALLIAPAIAQQPKELRTPKGRAIAVMNLKSIRPNCSTGTISVPVIREAPKSGVIVMAIATLDEAASGNCPARKIPVIVLVYTPLKEFAGTELVTIDIPEENKTTSVSFRIVVTDGEKL